MAHLKLLLKSLKPSSVCWTPSTFRCDLFVREAALARITLEPDLNHKRSVLLIGT